MLQTKVYTVGGTVQAGQGYYLERRADQELLELCRAGEFAYILSARQMGKSSLMVRTAKRLRAEGVQSVTLDLTLIGTQVEAQSWYFGLLFEINKQLGLSLDLAGWWEGHAGLGLTQRLTLFFEEIMTGWLDGTLVVFVDEIDTTLSLDFTDDFFAAVRALYMSRAHQVALARLSFVLIGVATPGDLVRDPRRTPFNIGERVEMTDFSLAQALPLASGFGLDEARAGQVLGWVLEWTGGHPYLTQRLCRVLASRPDGVASQAAVARVVESTFFQENSERDNNLQFVRDMLTKRASDRIGVLTTYREIWLARRPVADEEQSLVKSHLKLSGVVERQAGRLRVRNQVYRTVFNEEWIKAHLPVNWAKRLRQAFRVIAALLLLITVLGGLTVYALIQQNEATTQRDAAQSHSITAQAARQEAQNAQLTAEARRLDAESQRQLALSRELAANALNESETNLELSLLLALQAEKTVHTAQSEAALRQILLSSPLDKSWTVGGGGQPGQTAISLDRSRVALAVSDGKQATLSVLEVSTGKILASLVGPGVDGTPNSLLVFSPDNTRLASGGADGKLRLWSIGSGPSQLVSELSAPGGQPISRITFSPDSGSLVSGGQDGSLRLWNAQSGQLQATTPGHATPLTSLVFSPNGKRLLAGYGDGTARVYASETLKELLTLDKHTSTVSSVAFSPDGTKGLTASYDGTAHLWDATTGQELAVLTGHTDRINGAVFTPDGHKVLTVSRDRTARLWEVTGGKVLATLAGNPAEIVSFAVSLNGKGVALTGADRILRVWNTETTASGPILQIHTQAVVNNLAFSSDSTRLISLDANGRVQVWEASTRSGVSLLAGHTGPVNGAVFTPDGGRLISVGSDGLVKTWNTRDGRAAGQLDRSCGCPTYAIAFSPDGSRLVIGGGDGNIERWDYEDGKFSLREPLPVYKTAVQSLSFSSDGKRLVATSTSKTVEEVDVQSGAIVLTVENPGGLPGQAVFDPTGTRFVTGSEDGTLTVFDSASGKILQGWGWQNGPVKAVAFSPDGTRLASGGSDGVVHVTDTATGREVAVFKGHQGAVNSLSFSPDGRELASAGQDGTTRLWEVASQTQITSFSDHTGVVNSLSFSRDGRQLVTTGTDRTVRLYRQETFTPLADLLMLARSRVSRELTCNEQREYLHLEKCA